MILPRLRVGIALVADLVQDIVEIRNGVDDFPDIGFLNSGHCGDLKGVRFGAAPVVIRVAVNSIDIVLPG